MNESISPDLTLLALNAFELVLLSVALFILVRYIVGEIGDFRDFVRRIKRIMLHDYQGGAYDVAVAFAVILAGLWIGREATWDWREFWFAFPFWRFLLGIVVETTGVLCLIRILAPRSSYNRWWISTAIAAAVFSAASVAFKVLAH